MKLSELISRIGDENVAFQVLSHDLSNVKVGKRDGTITFHTSKAHAQDIMNATVREHPQQMIGLVVWMPRAKFDDEVQKAIALSDSPTP